MLRKRPHDMFAHDFAWVPGARLQRFGDSWRRFRVAQGDGNIPQPALMTNPAYRAALQALVEIGLRPGEKLHQRR